MAVQFISQLILDQTDQDQGRDAVDRATRQKIGLEGESVIDDAGLGTGLGTGLGAGFGDGLGDGLGSEWVLVKFNVDDGGLLRDMYQ